MDNGLGIRWRCTKFGGILLGARLNLMRVCVGVCVGFVVLHRATTHEGSSTHLCSGGYSVMGSCRRSILLPLPHEECDSSDECNNNNGSNNDANECSCAQSRFLFCRWGGALSGRFRLRCAYRS
jgi:hypothetical protein